MWEEQKTSQWGNHVRQDWQENVSGNREELPDPRHRVYSQMRVRRAVSQVLRARITTLLGVSPDEPGSMLTSLQRPPMLLGLWELCTRVPSSSGPNLFMLQY